MRLKHMLLYTLGLCLLSGMQVAVAGQPQDPCALPSGLHDEIAKKYPGMHPVTQADLDDYNRKLFRKDHGGRCPGLVKVNFYGDRKPTWALVLIPAESSNRKAELVVVRQLANGWEISSLDTVDASEVPVIWRQGPGKYDDVSEPKSIRARNPVIVICGYEVWARLYAWTGKEVEKVQISD